MDSPFAGLRMRKLITVNANESVNWRTYCHLHIFYNIININSVTAYTLIYLKADDYIWFEDYFCYYFSSDGKERKETVSKYLKFFNKIINENK